MSARKIDYAVAATDHFIANLHRPGFDRGMIATFGNTYQIVQNFTTEEPRLHAALEYARRHVTNEGTRLYDSIADAIMTFRQGADQGRPWLLTIITDGKDYFDAGRYRNRPDAIGQFAFSNYYFDPTNFLFLIGVGDEQDIDAQSLLTLGENGRFPVTMIEDFALLEVVFIQLAVQIIQKTVPGTFRAGNATWDMIAKVRQTSHIAFDYAFLIDRSGSMNDEVHPSQSNEVQIV